MSAPQLEKLEREYAKNRYAVGGGNREHSLSRPVTEQDRKIIKMAVTEFNLTASEICKELGVPMGSLIYRFGRAVARIAYQNPAILKQLLK